LSAAQFVGGENDRRACWATCCVAASGGGQIATGKNCRWLTLSVANIVGGHAGRFVVWPQVAVDKSLVAKSVGG